MKIVNSFVEYQREGSNWVVDKIIEMNIHVFNYHPLKGISYIPLPAARRPSSAYKIRIKNALCGPYWPRSIHPQNILNESFITYVQHVDRLNFTEIAFPVRICDISKFEKSKKCWPLAEPEKKYTINAASESLTDSWGIKMAIKIIIFILTTVFMVLQRDVYWKNTCLTAKYMEPSGSKCLQTMING